ncbi:Glutathione synthetase [Rickettsiales bacterium Ac37b]|nr:Glutathione synthetase [Rickettsiales bacterium Ac37b]
MTINIAIQMDPLANINFLTDTTILLAYEAYLRGYKIHYYNPTNLALNQSKVMAYVQQLTFGQEHKAYKLSPPELLDLSTMQVILIRQDPPFDMTYLTTTYILEHLSSKVLVINNPTEIRNCPEKIFVHNFQQFMPPTLITNNIQLIKEFKNKHNEVVLKPLYCYGGQDIIHLTHNDDNLDSLINMYMKLYSTPLIIQQYLPEVKYGDKRAILIDGELVGAFSRIPESGKIVSNLAAGGIACAAELTSHEKYICNIVGLELKKRGLFLAGLDFINEYITEINITSPTGFVSVNKFYNIKLEEIFWQKVSMLIVKTVEG